jgi:hypothetical protein
MIYSTETVEDVFLQLVSKFLAGTEWTGAIPPTEVLLPALLVYADVTDQTAAVREAFERNCRQAIATLRSVGDTAN